MFAVRPCQQDVRSSYDCAARCSQYDCAARYIPHTKTVVMLAIYYHSLSMESKYTDQVYLDLCLFIPAVKIRGYQIPRGIPRGMPNPLREFGTGMPNTLGYITRGCRKPGKPNPPMTPALRLRLACGRPE